MKITMETITALDTVSHFKVTKWLSPDTYRVPIVLAATLVTR
jgi:hypothetical protein